MSTAENDARYVMAEAERAVALYRSDFMHRVSSKVYYIARKQIRNAPRTAFKSAGAGVSLATGMPVLGTITNIAAGIALDTVLAKKKQAKSVHYHAMSDASPTVENLRKTSKADTKHHKTLLDKLDGNMVKMRDALRKRDAAMQAYASAMAATPPTTPSQDVVWGLACAIYNVKHYEDKIHLLAETMAAHMATVTNFIDVSRNQSHEMEAGLVAELAHLIKEVDMDPLAQKESQPGMFQRGMQAVKNAVKGEKRPSLDGFAKLE